jgi:hypothetical protein
MKPDANNPPRSDPTVEAGTNHSSYLDLPLLPLPTALSRMLETIEVEITTAGPEEKRRLEIRARLIRELLASRPVT